MRKRPAPDYDRIITTLFQQVRRRKGEAEVLPFSKRDLERCASAFGIKNVPDIIYSYRSRNQLPETILRTGNWVIEGRGKSEYAFVRITVSPHIDLPRDLGAIDIPDATPEIVERYSGSDEQGLLARIRYNRLVDVFTSVTAYLLQSHLRTTLKQVGQIEIDDLYLGVDTDGRWYILPVEAKGPKERIGRVQISNMTAFAQQRFPELTLRPLAAQEFTYGSIFFFEFNGKVEIQEIAVTEAKRYRLIRQER